ncbi:MAG TPA: hypothetical protein DCQ83_05030 [Fibrobacteres bacterium]|jgi:peptidoglycan/LPS O-acetylase OafA/YrhL|nr:hypothetical protein [Fibrobacterota bacterium]
MSQSDIKKYAYIDALRGIAVLGVMLVHSSQSVAPASAQLLRFMSTGARGVQLFYIASALTLCMSWMARSSREAHPIRNFYIRRFFRIAPMFYIAIIAYLLLSGLSASHWAPNGIRGWFIPITALFLNGFHPETITSIVPGGWSIAVEMTFYLVLPFLFHHIKSMKSCLVFFFISLGLFALNKALMPHIYAYPESQKYLVENFAYFNFFGQFPVFMVGILCYLVIRKGYPRQRIAMVAVPLFVALLLFFLKSSHHIIASAFFLSTFAVLAANWPIRLLVNPVTTTLGKLSYSLYLVHFATLIYFEKFGFNRMFPRSNIGSVTYYLCVVIATTAFAFLSYRYVEQRGIALGKRLIEKLEMNASRKTDAGIH